MNKSLKGTIVAAAAAGLFSACASSKPAATGTTAAPSGGDMVMCSGINECKGTGACGAPGAGHDCAGKNECKGKGVMKVSNAEECTTKGGTVPAPPSS